MARGEEAQHLCRGHLGSDDDLRQRLNIKAKVIKASAFRVAGCKEKDMCQLLLLGDANEELKEIAGVLLCCGGHCSKSEHRLVNHNHWILLRRLAAAYKCGNQGLW